MRTLPLNYVWGQQAHFAHTFLYHQFPPERKNVSYTFVKCRQNQWFSTITSDEQNLLLLILWWNFQLEDSDLMTHPEEI